jgi:GH25 family lysozyme M1 (1,4-beta-N-acetylmuramidase)
VGASDASAAGVIDGPDVSSYQHPYGAAIKWSTVAKTGKEFAIVKATEGTSYVNPWFKTDYSRIRQVGMVRGSYHFARSRRRGTTCTASGRLRGCRAHCRRRSTWR